MNTMKEEKINPHMGPETIRIRKILASLPQIKTTAEEAREQVKRHREEALRNPFPTGPNTSQG